MLVKSVFANTFIFNVLPYSLNCAHNFISKFTRKMFCY
uniref:Uncharacterized protein n=1 Tax=Myoviridae sp. ct1IL4 TaxID=2825019 RepID=A0A8S5Q6A5_9CAUD|nr:MAG TPA: hypothetical protein [Myoviridae sp. ct1IL4]